jgi:hypothetical protein
MSKILSFEEYHLKNNEADLFGVTTSPKNNVPADYKEDKISKDVEDLRGIDPLNHNLKLTSTDFLEFATLKDSKTGKNYIFYFDSTDPEFEENYKIWDERAEEYLGPDAIGIEAAANDVPEMEIGFGTDDWENSETPLVELDEELTDDMIEEFNVFVGQAGSSRRDKMKVQEELKKILSEIQLTTESLEFESTEEILEKKGISSAIRDLLLKYLKDNKDATYSEAEKFIEEKIPGWNFKKEDFEEAKNIPQNEY